MNLEKKKLSVGIISSPVWLRTGFGGVMKVLLPYLYKTGKYELFHLNQGVGNAPEFQRYPWSNEAAIRPELIDHAKFNNPAEEAYRRYVSYGNPAIEDFIVKNSLEAVIFCDDIWGADVNTYLNSKWFPYFKDNLLMYSTADSSPVLPLFKEYAQKTNLWVWASFAEKELKKENSVLYKDVETVHGAVDINEYFPISKEEKLRLRKDFGIDEDCKVFLFLSRNQLRKLFLRCIEAFAKFKKENPNQKAKLFFHCSWSEPHGWNIPKAIEDYGLDKEDVLATYFCQKCGKWEVKHFQGEGLDCKFCGAEKQQITAGVTSSVSNKDLSKIYGLADGSLAVFTSGGQEMHLIQSLLCEVPLLCSEYSCGEDFVCHDFVFRCDGTYTDEVQTNFKKFVPNLNTISNFYKTICDLPEQEKNKIVKKGSEWAKKTFDINTIGKKFEEWLDSRKPIQWDYKFQEEPLKNPGAQIPDIANNLEWIICLYKEILKMENVDANDSGVKFWLSELENRRRTREDILNFFRATADDHNRKQKSKPIPFESLLDKTGNKRFLINAPESAGDIINLTACLDSLKKSYPNTDIYVGTKPEFHDILNGNPNIHKVLPWIPVMDQEIAMTNNGLFDYYCSPFVGSQKHLTYLTHKNLNLIN